MSENDRETWMRIECARLLDDTKVVPVSLRDELEPETIFRRAVERTRLLAKENLDEQSFQEIAKKAIVDQIVAIWRGGRSAWIEKACHAYITDIHFVPALFRTGLVVKRIRNAVLRKLEHTNFEESAEGELLFRALARVAYINNILETWKDRNWHTTKELCQQNFNHFRSLLKADGRTPEKEPPRPYVDVAWMRFARTYLGRMTKTNDVAAASATQESRLPTRTAFAYLFSKILRNVIIDYLKVTHRHAPIQDIEPFTTVEPGDVASAKEEIELKTSFAVLLISQFRLQDKEKIEREYKSDDISEGDVIIKYFFPHVSAEAFTFIRSENHDGVAEATADTLYRDYMRVRHRPYPTFEKISEYYGISIRRVGHVCHRYVSGVIALAGTKSYQ